MFSASTALLSFFIGIVGTIFGGTQTFIVTGFVGLFVYTLKAFGIESPFLTETLMNTVFLPAIIFNAATLSTAYAARNHDVDGWDISHSLLFTHDPLVSLMGGVGGVAGYLLFALARGLNLPLDQGALSIIILSTITRVVLGHGHWINPNATAYYKKEGTRYWAFQLINTVGVCGLTALVLEQMDPAFYNVVFNISAALILLTTFDQDRRTYPTTHHETLVVAYAMAATGANVIVSALFGILANLIYLLFARYFNEECDTHIDPPAVAIAICSLILFTCF